MSHIFISYSKHNQEYARKLADYLKSEGFEIWIDDRIDYGDTWERVIFQKIDECAALLVVMTPQSYESDWVLRECQYAEKRRKPQFPVLLDGEEFPRYVSTQYLDVRGGKLPGDDFIRRVERVAPRKKVVGEDVTEKPQPQATNMAGISGDLELKVIRSEELQVVNEAKFKPPDVSSILPPPFEWCEIPAGQVTIEYSESDHRTFDVPQFWMAKYPITNAQYQVFVDSRNGYGDLERWQYSHAANAWRWENHAPKSPGLVGADLPRTKITWYESVAFCVWLKERLIPIDLENWSVMLPTEQQWQRAAQGNDRRIYPWGNQFDKGLCNTRESGISKPTPVTQYPMGASQFGAMDMAGNVWEWCLTQFPSNNNDLEGEYRRLVRGGSYDRLSHEARVMFRDPDLPINSVRYTGFRVAYTIVKS